jgi:hypothetical protein
MTINVVRGLVDSLQARQNQTLKTSDLSKQANNPNSTQNQALSRQLANSEAVVTSSKTLRSNSGVESERVKDSKGARDLAKSIGDKVKGDSTTAKDAHQLSSESGQALLV